MKSRITITILLFLLPLLAGACFIGKKQVAFLNDSQRSHLEQVIAQLETAPEKFFHHLAGDFYFNTFEPNNRTRLRGGSHLIREKMGPHFGVLLDEFLKRDMTNEPSRLDEFKLDGIQTALARGLDWHQPVDRLLLALNLGRADLPVMKNYNRDARIPEQYVRYAYGDNAWPEIAAKIARFGPAEVAMIRHLGLDPHSAFDQTYFVLQMGYYQGYEMQALGLDVMSPLDNHVHRLFVLDTISGPFIEPNGVVRTIYLKDLMNTKAWRASVEAAAAGRAPIGAKTYFPVTWSKQKILAATIAVLRQQSSRIIRLEGNSDDTKVGSLVLENEYDGVTVVVQMRGTVNSAYPAWNQTPHLSRQQLEARRTFVLEKIMENIHDLAMTQDAAAVLTLEQAIAIYLGRTEEIALSAHDLQVYRAFISPEAVLPSIEKVATPEEFALFEYALRHLIPEYLMWNAKLESK